MQRLETYFHAGVVFTHLAIKARVRAGRFARALVLRVWRTGSAPPRACVTHDLLGPLALTLGTAYRWRC
jgi:hypothetical protein